MLVARQKNAIRIDCAAKFIGCNAKMTMHVVVGRDSCRLSGTRIATAAKSDVDVGNFAGKGKVR